MLRIIVTIVIIITIVIVTIVIIVIIITIVIIIIVNLQFVARSLRALSYRVCVHRGAHSEICATMLQAETLWLHELLCSRPWAKSHLCRFCFFSSSTCEDAAGT